MRRISGSIGPLEVFLPDLIQPAELLEVDISAAVHIGVLHELVEDGTDLLCWAPVTHQIQQGLGPPSHEDTVSRNII